jgi:hypothetical protein
MPCSVQYHFVQSFSVPAKRAFDWCTQYDPADHVLMGERDAERKITRITANTIILTDTFHIGGECVEKQKLVQLYPDKLKWTSTHLTGPIKYSQFIYEISEEDKETSHLDFLGLFIDYGREKLDEVSYKKIAEMLRKEDSDAWKLLAKAMKQALCK